MTVVDEVKSRLDIVEIVSNYVTLDRSGRRFKAPCPFHQEKTPSFMVYPDRQSWHCYGACASGGDVFSFVMRAENLDFAETLRRLSQQAGVALPTSQRHTREQVAYQINEAAKSYYQGILASDQGRSARTYLEKRGLTEESISRFELGLSPQDGESLRNHLTQQGFSLDQLTEAGVVRVNDRGQSRDLFRGRLIIPIRNSHGELGGFGSRALDDSVPKYLNSARTPVFDKGRILYGLYLAQEAARQQGLVIVEGYMDAIMAHQNGFTNVVASMGTALTRDQVTEIRRLTGNVVMALDPDAAGQQATLRSLATSWEVFQKLVTERDRRQQSRETIIFQRQEDLELKVMSLPDNLDPDELIRRSPQEWADLVEGAVPLFEYLLPAVSHQLDISTPRGKARVVEILFPFIAAVSEPIQQDLYFQQLAAYIGVDEGTLKASTGRFANRSGGSGSTGPGRRPKQAGREVEPTAS
ncbi:MAG: DNA primase, partial [Stenotrophomonas maltophilia]